MHKLLAKKTPWTDMVPLKMPLLFMKNEIYISSGSNALIVVNDNFELNQSLKSFEISAENIEMYYLTQQKVY